MQLPEKSNLAYDLSYFETREKSKARPKVAPEIAVLPESRAKAGSVIKCLLVAAVAFGLLFSLISSKVKLSELNYAIIAGDNALSVAQAENYRLQSVLDSQITLKYVEDQAENVLGMKKVSRSQIDYISVNTENMIEVNDSANEGNVFRDAKNWVSGILEYLGF